MLGIKICKCTDKEVFDHVKNNDPGLEKFIDALVKLQEARNNARKAVLRLCVGKAKRNGFVSYLKNRLEDPEIFFSSVHINTANKIPQLIISDGISTIAVFTLSDLSVISENIGEDDGSSFIRHNFKIRVPDGFDYSFSMSIYK